MNSLRFVAWKAAAAVCAMLCLFVLPCVAQDTTSPTIRSVLYPADWQPGYTDSQGRFLQDYSYAGYNHGAGKIPRVAGPIFSVTSYGAVTTTTADSTAAIQATINAAQKAGGGVVFFPRGTYRVDGQLTVTKSRIVLRGESPETSRVYFTKFAGMTDQAHLLIRSQLSYPNKKLLVEDAQIGDFWVKVPDVTGLQVGQDVAIGWVITEAFVAEHGMTGIWQAFNGMWKPFYRRTITKIDTSVSPPRVRLDVPIRYPSKVRDEASLEVETGWLEECGVEDLGVSSAVGYANAASIPRQHIIRFDGVKNGWARNVKSFAAPVAIAAGKHLLCCGIKLLECKACTVVDCTMEFAENRGDGGSGYLFEVSKSSDCLFLRCVARFGRHNFIQNWDFGCTGIVWLKCYSEGSAQYLLLWGIPFEVPTSSEYHHSLATACLVDSCTILDSWRGFNRLAESSGAGHSQTQCVFWNNKGTGWIGSWQYGMGYVIGTAPGMPVYTAITNDNNGSLWTEPEDFTEAIGQGALLEPQSLYEAQLAQRVRSNWIAH